jgi:hypothetical protein
MNNPKLTFKPNKTQNCSNENNNNLLKLKWSTFHSRWSVKAIKIGQDLNREKES